jgi:hypothetical protein
MIFILKILITIIFFMNVSYANVTLLFPPEIIIYIDENGSIISDTEIEFGSVGHHTILPPSGSKTCYTKGYAQGNGNVIINDMISLKITAKDWRDNAPLQYVPRQTFPYSGDPLNQSGTAVGLGFNVQATLLVTSGQQLEAGLYDIPNVTTNITLNGDEYNYDGSYMEGCIKGMGILGPIGTKSEGIDIGGSSKLRIVYKE